MDKHWSNKVLFYLTELEWLDWEGKSHFAMVMLIDCRPDALQQGEHTVMVMQPNWKPDIIHLS